jgi:hypothetical protein
LGSAVVRRLLPRERASWAGLAAGPGAWAVGTQLNYALAPWICAHKISLVPILALVLAAVALAGAFVSWRAWNGAAVEESEVHAAVLEAPRPFLAGVSVLLGVLFALVILTQGAAGLVLNGCER